MAPSKTNISISVPIPFIEWADTMHGTGKAFSSRSHVWEYAMARFIVERDGQDAYDALLQG
jgi:hypothetical protein